MLGSLLLTACSAPTESSADGEGGDEFAQHEVTVENCGEEVTFQAPAKRMFVNDSNIISIAVAAGAAKNIGAISRLDDKKILESVYGDEVRELDLVSPDYPSLETVLAADPDVMFAGYGYGFSDEKNLTPASLEEHGIDSYQLSEACRSGEGSARGTMDPWDAVETDLRNIAEIAGDTGRANDVIADIDARRAMLAKTPAAGEKPTAFLFDSGSDSVFTSGSFGAPQAILEAAGARNATEDIKDTWTSVNWEKIAASAPDVFVFVDYPPETLEQKVAALRANPATRDLPAVRENRFINLPYALWCSGPLNIDAAEIVRKGLESYGLVPDSDIEPQFPMSDLDVDGNDWAK
ncbi:ABC transporter substrate-binding protein [Dietzia sp.]|uniref:ABC transporter substrate-binding protein n=1 Tax=Dietzia sp. TaxID=1871616 RepID=UPI002FDB4440